MSLFRTPLLEASICLLSILVLAMACKSPPYVPDPNAQARVNDLLANYSRKQELSDFVGGPPASCMRSSETTELCEWRVGDRQTGWRAMAEAIRTRDRVNLLCELPISRGPRARGACSIHPRRSNRYSWRVPVNSRTRSGSKAAETAAKVRKRYRLMVSQWIDEANTLARLSRLIGALPDRCTKHSEAEQICLWRAANHTYGHGTLSAWIGAPKRKKIRLRCVLPIDGSPRAPDSCFAEVGG